MNRKINKSEFISVGSNYRRTCSFYIFVMNFSKLVLYFRCSVWICLSSLKGEFDIFFSGIDSSYNGSVRFAFQSWKTEHLVSIFIAVNCTQNRFYLHTTHIVLFFPSIGCHFSVLGLFTSTMFQII